MLSIYTSQVTNRIAYTMDYVFREQFGIEYSIVTGDIKAFEKMAGPKFTYTNEKIDEGVYVVCSGLLYETEVQQQELGLNTCNDVRVLFAHNDTGSLLNFDVFAAIFYLLSRYEEYLDQKKDIHGNYDCTNSILYKLDLLGSPVVEQWLDILKKALLKTFPSLTFRHEKARCLLSFDIDVAYAYRGRNFVRTAGGFIKKIMQLNLKRFKEQLVTVLNFKPDMFDTYPYIAGKVQDITAIFFFNMGGYGKYDKNPSHKNKLFRKLIRSISEKYTVGLHPSYGSNANKRLLEFEKDKLEKIIKKEITASRQHYLKLKLPETYRRLIANGIEMDFTMGYYYTYGFRAGTCKSFLFFDLLNNQATTLRLFPFAFMEGSLNDVLKMNIEKAKVTVSALIHVVKQYNGIFIPLWHNSTLCDADGWKGWRKVFEHMIGELKKNEFQNVTHL